MKKQRKQYSREEKVAILRRHLLEHEAISKLCDELGLDREGKVNERNGWVPRDFWLDEWEKQAIVGFHLKNPLEGYWRMTFMMLDGDIVAVSPSSVWRVLSQAGLLSKWNRKRRALASCSRWPRMDTGTSMFPISILVGRSTTCAAFWTATAGTS